MEDGCRKGGRSDGRMGGEGEVMEGWEGREKSKLNVYLLMCVVEALGL